MSAEGLSSAESAIQNEQDENVTQEKRFSRKTVGRVTKPSSSGNNSSRTRRLHIHPTIQDLVEASSSGERLSIKPQKYSKIDISLPLITAYPSSCLPLNKDVVIDAGRGLWMSKHEVVMFYLKPNKGGKRLTGAMDCKYYDLLQQNIRDYHQSLIQDDATIGNEV